MLLDTSGLLAYHHDRENNQDADRGGDSVRWSTAPRPATGPPQVAHHQAGERNRQSRAE